jgi:hypothetical protein
MIRSPATVCWRMSARSPSLSTRGLERIDSGIAILPMSCSSAAIRTRSTSAGPQPSSHATSSTRRTTSSRWLDQ